jgi:hypothetical protein
LLAGVFATDFLDFGVAFSKTGGAGALTRPDLLFPLSKIVVGPSAANDFHGGEIGFEADRDLEADWRSASLRFLELVAGGVEGRSDASNLMSSSELRGESESKRVLWSAEASSVLSVGCASGIGESSTIWLLSADVLSWFSIF